MQRINVAPDAMENYMGPFEGPVFVRPLERIDRLRQVMLAMACFLLPWHIIRFGEINFSADWLDFQRRSVALG